MPLEKKKKVLSRHDNPNSIEKSSSAKRLGYVSVSTSRLDLFPSCIT